MTLLRKLAIGISNGVACKASPDTKDWAHATSREIEFIQSDWAALRWALGGIGILFRRPEIPLSSLAEIPQAALSFAKEIRKRTITGTFICAFEIVWFASTFHTTTNTTEQVGCLLTIGAMLYMGYQLLARRSTLSLRDESPTTPDAYRSELELQRDFHSGGWLWSRVVLMVPGFLLFCIGLAGTHPRSTISIAGTTAALLTLCTLAIPNNLRIARRYQRRIDDLDAVEKGQA
jgi:hypothetical protein